MKKLIGQCLLLLAFMAMSLSLVAAEWRLEKDDDGIQVFTRAVEGSDYRAFRGETLINAELNQLMAVLDDTAIN